MAATLGRNGKDEKVCTEQHSSKGKSSAVQAVSANIPMYFATQTMNTF